jgi:hypothetical protein
LITLSKMTVLTCIAIISAIKAVHAITVTDDRNLKRWDILIGIKLLTLTVACTITIF